MSKIYVSQIAEGWSTFSNKKAWDETESCNRSWKDDLRIKNVFELTSLLDNNWWCNKKRDVNHYYPTKNCQSLKAMNWYWLVWPQLVQPYISLLCFNFHVKQDLVPFAWIYLYFFDGRWDYGKLYLNRYFPSTQLSNKSWKEH